MKFCLLFAAALACAQAQPAVRVLVAYHSVSGNTAKLAESIRDGAASVEGVAVVLRAAGEVRDEEIAQADGILVGTPVHWSDVSAETRRLVDRVGAVLQKKSKAIGDGRTAGAFCTAGGVAMGKDLARLSILAAFLTMRFAVLGGVDPYGFGTLGPQATTGPDDPGVSAKEAAEGRLFGERFARFTLRMRAAR